MMEDDFTFIIISFWIAISVLGLVYFLEWRRKVLGGK
jgi:hypothetical protein